MRRVKRNAVSKNFTALLCPLDSFTNYYTIGKQVRQRYDATCTLGSTPPALQALVNRRRLFHRRHLIKQHSSSVANVETDNAENGNGSMSELARTFLGFRDEVLQKWSSRVTAEIPRAKRLGEPVLLNMLPTLYENIADALSVGKSRCLASSGTTLGIAHGRERANMTEYGPHDLIHELQIFREVLFSVAKENNLPLSKRDLEVIGHSIEQTARESISGYSAANKQVSEEFIASLSHDLRNPLHVAIATAQLIERKTSDPIIAGMAKRICRKLGETDAMIQTLLDAALLQGQMKLKLNLTSFDMLSLVEEVCADIPVLGQSVKIVGEQVVGWWCRASMKRVLENLISNARKYGDFSEAITVRVRRVDSRMILSVHNEGPPIPKADMERMFKTFERIEDIAVTGWGLGLPYVQNVAESHGGTVVVDSAEDRGTTFTVSVPIDTRPYVGS